MQQDEKLDQHRHISDIEQNDVRRRLDVAFRELVSVTPPARIRRAFLNTKFLIERVPLSTEVQVFYPTLLVAGQGYCLCSASLEAMNQLIIKLEAVKADGSWDGFVTGACSLHDRLALLRTGIIMRLAHWVNSYVDPCDRDIQLNPPSLRLAI